MKTEKRKSAVKLRKLGLSYSEISKELKVSKGSLSSWLADIKLGKLSNNVLIKKHQAEIKSRVEAMNMARKAIRDKQIVQYLGEADDLYLKFKDNRLFLVGTSIYWGEGEKKNKYRVSVINSDPRMVKLEVKYFRRILKVPEYKLRAAVFIYNDAEVNDAIDFWSKKLGIKKNQFIKTQILPTKSASPSRKLEYGMCNIYFSNFKLNLFVQRWIELLYRNTRA